MVSEEEVFNLSTCREVLRSFSLSDTQTSMELNLCHAHAHHDSLMHQQVAVKDAPEMAQLLDAKQESMEQIIEEEQAHRAQVAALSQMKLQAMEEVEAQEKELQRLSALLEEHHVGLKSSPERPYQEPPTASNLSQLRHEVIDHPPSTLNTIRGAESKTGQVSDLGRPPIVKGDTFVDILADAQVPITPQVQVQFADIAASTPIPRPTEHAVERTPH